jgi:hypothetical protein
MKEELAGMNTGICPSAAKHGHGSFKYPAQAIFQNFLHGRLSGLPLPAAVTGAFIGYMYEMAQMIILVYEARKYCRILYPAVPGIGNYYFRSFAIRK